MKRVWFLIAVFSLLTACASPYPLGMSEEQWKSITPQERQALLLKQQQYEEEQRLVRIKEEAKERQLQLKRDIAEKKRLDALYNNPQNGNVVMVNILGGKYKY
jgi:TRAP-type C4-dicarboxylate transport system substrate-binding protein